MINILFVVAFQSFILAFLLFLNKKDKKEDYYLMTFFAAIFLHVVFKMALSYFFDALVFNKVHASFSLLYGPILYFVYSAANGIELSNRKVFCHTVPFLFSSIINVLFLIYLSLGKEDEQLIGVYEMLSVLLFIPSLFFYPLYCFKKTGFFLNFKDATDTALWNKIVQLISYFLLFSASIATLGLFFVLTNFANPIDFRYLYYFVLLITMITTLNYRMKLSQMGQPFIVETAVAGKSKEKYKNYDLNQDEMDALIEKINHCFHSQKVYLNPDFSLDLLSNEINVPKIKITQALNIKLDSNFYNYLNSFRIEESKRLIQNSAKASLTDISFESGFKNKSTFYKNFKLLNGITPKEYQKNIQLSFG